MAQATALFFAAVLCIVLQHAECVEPHKRLLVDTPEKYAQLKQGFYDDKFRIVDVTVDATPDILLQPQYFGNSSFLVMTFTEPSEEGNNTINLFPGQWPAVTAYFKHDENTLAGMPKDYQVYRIFYQYPATPTVENIDSILQWKNTRELHISDLEDVSVSLFKRIDELSKLKKLWLLNLCVQDDTWEQLKVATFMDNMIGLKQINVKGNHMTIDDMKEFEFKNKIPWNWRGKLDEARRLMVYKIQKQ